MGAHAYACGNCGAAVFKKKDNAAKAFALSVGEGREKKGGIQAGNQGGRLEKV